MKADLSTMVGGQPMFVIRRFLRQVGPTSWGVSYVRRFFDVNESEARDLVAAMARKGYLKKSDHPISDNLWEVAAAGKRIALAAGAKKITRDAADRMVSGLLQRAEEVNASDNYLFRVSKITAFGSYVEEEQTIDDIDVEIELKPKESDTNKHLRALEEKVSLEKSGGRTFGSQGEELGWGELEVLLYLKARSRYLSIVQIPREWRKTLASRVLFEG